VFDLVFAGMSLRRRLGRAVKDRGGGLVLWATAKFSRRADADVFGLHFMQQQIGKFWLHSLPRVASALQRCRSVIVATVGVYARS